MLRQAHTVKVWTSRERDDRTSEQDRGQVWIPEVAEG